MLTKVLVLGLSVQVPAVTIQRYHASMQRALLWIEANPAFACIRRLNVERRYRLPPHEELSHIR